MEPNIDAVIGRQEIDLIHASQIKIKLYFITTLMDSKKKHPW
jgi:hypothetical protein